MARRNGWESKMEERRKWEKDKNGKKERKNGWYCPSTMMGDECASYAENILNVSMKILGAMTTWRREFSQG
jgi:hypothetical protein